MAVKLLVHEKSLFEKAKEFSLEKIAPYADKWENGGKSSRDAMKVFVENGYCSTGVSKKLCGRGYNFRMCSNFAIH